MEQPKHQQQWNATDLGQEGKAGCRNCTLRSHDDRLFSKGFQSVMAIRA